MKRIFLLLVIICSCPVIKAQSNQAVLEPLLLEKLVALDAYKTISAPLMVRGTNLPVSLYHKLVAELMTHGLSLTESTENATILTLVFEPENKIVRTSKSEAQRSLSVSVHVTLSQPDKSILYAGSFTVKKSDVINWPAENFTGTDEMYRFQETEYAPSRLRIARYAEPLLISGATIITAYLLYNVRSR